MPSQMPSKVFDIRHISVRTSKLCQHQYFLFAHFLAHQASSAPKSGAVDIVRM